MEANHSKRKNKSKAVDKMVFYAIMSSLLDLNRLVKEKALRLARQLRRQNHHLAWVVTIVRNKRWDPDRKSKPAANADAAPKPSKSKAKGKPKAKEARAKTHQSRFTHKVIEAGRVDIVKVVDTHGKEPDGYDAVQQDGDTIIWRRQGKRLCEARTARDERLCELAAAETDNVVPLRTATAA